MRSLNIPTNFLSVCVLVSTVLGCSRNQTAETNTAADTISNVVEPIDTPTMPHDVSPPRDSNGKIPADPNGNYLIVPGKTMGKIDIGMDQDLTLKALGKPDSSDAAMGTVVYTWLGKTKPYRSELNVITSYADSDMKKRWVKMIRTTSPYFLTKAGDGVQKNLAELKKNYPLLKLLKTYNSSNHAASVDIYADEGAGILFECLSNDQKLCVGVQVFQPGKLPGMEF
jgi:hypothetical protein